MCVAQIQPVTSRIPVCSAQVVANTALHQETSSVCAASPYGWPVMGSMLSAALRNLELVKCVYVLQIRKLKSREEALFKFR